MLSLTSPGYRYNADMRLHDQHSLKEEDRAGSIAWARSLVESGEFCVLDSETTGLKTPVQFVEVAIVDAGARTLFEGTVRPGCRIEAGATRIHGHTTRSLASLLGDLPRSIGGAMGEEGRRLQRFLRQEGLEYGR
jgi:hypothetical protein